MGPQAEWNQTFKRFTTLDTQHVVEIVVSQGVLLLARDWSYPLLAYNLSNGELLWESAMDHKDVEPVIVDGVVYVSNFDDELYPNSPSALVALDLKTGQEQWRFTLPEFYYPGLNSSHVVMPAWVTVHDNRIYLGTWSPRMYALDLQTHEVVWEFLADDWTMNNEMMIGPAVPSGDSLYLVGRGSTLYKVDAATGEVIWRSSDRFVLFPTPNATGERVFVESSEYFYNVVVLHGENGTKEWDARVPTNIHHPPIIHNETAYYYAWNNYFYAISLDGYEKWRFRTGNATDCTDNWVCQRISPAPAYYDGHVFVAGLDGVLYAFDADHGTVEWSKSLPGQQWTSPVVVGDYVYIGVDNTLRSIRWR